jgi:hypothetical protein
MEKKFNTKNLDSSNVGQIQLGETVAVIVIVIIILFVGIVFWNKVDISSAKDVASQSNELSVIEIANIIPEMPELKCYESSVSKVKCLDLYKSLAMSEANNDSTRPEIFQYYNYYFQNSKITINILYPQYNETWGADPEYNITLYDAKLAGSTKTLMISMPANIKDYVHKKTYYGIVIVEGYYIQQ